MLAVTGLTVKYSPSDKARALNGVSFSAREGERIALIGANGAGKSTLLLSLVGVLEPVEGLVSIGGTLLGKSTLKELRRKVGMIFQNPDDQLFMPTVHEDIAFGPRNCGMDEEMVEARIGAVLESLGISHLRDRMAQKLSGGEKRLVSLAGVLVMEPSVLLLDEPSSFLDPRARRRLIGVLEGLPQTMLLTTHDLDLALDLCERVILLEEGHIRADGPAAEVLRNEPLLVECGLELPPSLSRKN